jgi:hypothetical protein
MEGEHEAWEQPLWSARGSPATSSASSLADEPDDDKVFVAVPEDVGDGRSTLLWALHNVVGDGSKLVIVHVHSPARAIATSKLSISLQNKEIGGETEKTFHTFKHEMHFFIQIFFWRAERECLNLAFLC